MTYNKAYRDKYYAEHKDKVLADAKKRREAKKVGSPEIVKVVKSKKEVITKKEVNDMAIKKAVNISKKKVITK